MFVLCRPFGLLKSTFDDSLRNLNVRMICRLVIDQKAFEHFSKLQTDSSFISKNVTIDDTDFIKRYCLDKNLATYLAPDAVTPPTRSTCAVATAQCGFATVMIWVCCDPQCRFIQFYFTQGEVNGKQAAFI